jgi:hypothetical protein
MMRPFAFVLAALVVTAGTARAQVVEDSTHLARGITGFEMTVGQISGVTGFLFSSPSTSWVIGVDRLRHETIVGTRTLHSSSPGFRLGVRKWPTSMTGPFKIFVGAGLASGDIEPNEFGSQDQVGYGELGTVYFIGKHLSLNVNGELSIVYGDDHTRDPSTSLPTTRTRGFFAGGPRLRTGLAVYLF